jgi:hypothetical protein
VFHHETMDLAVASNPRRGRARHMGLLGFSVRASCERSGAAHACGARDGVKSRSAVAGRGVLATGLVRWLGFAHEIHRLGDGSVDAFLEWEALVPVSSRLFLLEKLRALDFRKLSSPRSAKAKTTLVMLLRASKRSRLRGRTTADLTRSSVRLKCIRSWVLF